MFIDFTKEMMKRNFAEDGVPNIDEFITWLKPNEDDDFETMACKSFLVLFKEVLQTNMKIEELETKIENQSLNFEALRIALAEL